MWPFSCAEDNLVCWRLFDVEVRGSYVEAKMMRGDLLRAVEKSGDQYYVVVEDGQEIFYFGSPVLPYRITVVDEGEV